MMMLRAYCDSPCTERELEPANEEHFAKVMRSLSMLKRRGDDNLTAKLRDALYWAKLRHLPRAVIAFIADKGLERWEWFPTIKECLDLAAEWSPPMDTDAQVRLLADGRIKREERLRYDDAMLALRLRQLDAKAISALPEQWRQHAETAGYLWRWPDGTFTVRHDSIQAKGDDLEACRAEASAWSEAWDRWANEQRDQAA